MGLRRLICNRGGACCRAAATAREGSRQAPESCAFGGAGASLDFGLSGLSVLPIKPFPLIPLAAAALWGAAASAQSPAPYKPNKNDDASRHDVASSVDKSRPLLHPVTCDKCMAKGVPVITRQEIYREGWIDLNKNGTKEACEDASQPVKKRVGDLLARMTRQERTMRLVALCGYNQVTPEYLPSTAWLNELHKDGIANIDEHLGGFS